jgi:hypothetical protein
VSFQSRVVTHTSNFFNTDADVFWQTTPPARQCVFYEAETYCNCEYVSAINVEIDYRTRQLCWINNLRISTTWFILHLNYKIYCGWISNLSFSFKRNVVFPKYTGNRVGYIHSSFLREKEKYVFRNIVRVVCYGERECLAPKFPI